ncbi:Z1 domain-containing protein [Pseudomonadota bacterium]
MSILANIKLIATGLIDAAKDQTGGQLTQELIRHSVTQALAIVPGNTDEIDVEQLVAEFERDYHTFVGQVLTLSDDEDGWEPWIAKEKSDICWRYWERFRTYLLQQQNFPKVVVDAIDEITDETLGNLTNPTTDGPWDRRGMVVGHVQAGKTTNYSGLICKAADAGYKVIIVLTGFHNNLRTQTQIRLEEAFVGYDITASQEHERRVPVGVGEISSDPSLRVDTITNRSDTGDFNRQVANNFSINPGGRPLVFVIKKNATILKNLLSYLEYVHTEKDADGKLHISGIPLLLIDDEADQGSVDTKKMDLGEDDNDPDPEHDPTRLNGLLRRILNVFSQSAYVGYTATPFANIFIHNEAKSTDYGEDLFPRSFITVMPTPSNYIGPEKVFGLIEDDGESRAPGLPIVRPITDYAKTESLNEREGWMPPKHNKLHFPKYESESRIPPSLHEALIAFVIGIAVRRARGQTQKHNSMLVHVTRFIDVQERVFEQVRGAMIDFKNALQYGEEGSGQKLMEEMHQLWVNDFHQCNQAINDPLCPEHSWEEISREIPPAIQSVMVRRINGSASDVLDYDKHKKSGLNVVAIGGDKLSRGLTLEGLTVSYFTRPSKMYDTLMQMGRWFGYRDGFVDICRLYAPSTLREWFEHITDASDELRRAFVLMCEMGETPATYGQRVRSHPVLMVTSQVKMRHSTQLTCSYQGAISETIVFSRETTDVERNFEAGEALISKIDGYAPLSTAPVRAANRAAAGKFMWSGVEPDDILDFLRSYRSPPHARRVNTSILAQYIEKQIDNGDLDDWSVLLAGKAPDEAKLTVSITNHQTGLLTRANHWARTEEGKDSPLFYRVRRLVSPADEAWDLTSEEYQQAIDLTDEDKSTRPGGEEIRVFRDRSKALLILYPLENQEKTQPKTETNACYLGFAISFPGNKNDHPISYRVNEVYRGQLDG